MTDALSDDERARAAAGDVNVLAALMLAGSSVFAGINLWLGTLGWLAALLTVSSTLAWSLGLWTRSPVTTSFVKIGFGFSGLAAPLFGVAGLVLGALGTTWGWAILAGAIGYFALSVLGLEIIERAYEHDVIDEYSRF